MLERDEDDENGDPESPSSNVSTELDPASGIYMLHVCVFAAVSSSPAPVVFARARIVLQITTYACIYPFVSVQSGNSFSTCPH